MDADVGTLFRLADVGILTTSVVAVIQFLQLGSSLAHPLRIGLYCFAASIPMAALQLIQLTVQELSDYELSFPGAMVHALFLGLCLVLFFTGLSGIFAYFSFGACIVFMLTSTVTLLLVYINSWYQSQGGILSLLFTIVTTLLWPIGAGVLLHHNRDTE